MERFDQQIYLNLAQGTSVFKPAEINILNEILTEYFSCPERDYFLFEEEKEKQLLGFVIFGKTALTDFSWDVYWLAVDKQCQGKGIGRCLLKKVEDFVKQREAKAILRVETSTRKEYAHARNLYSKQGFKEVGQIPDFYSPQDNLLIFYKDC